VLKRRDVQKERQWAIKRLFDGEHVDSICVSLGRSRAWIYKWAERSLQDNPEWYKSQSRRPLNSPLHTSGKIEEIVKLVRLNLYNHGLFCGDQAIRWELEEMGVKPLPSLRTISRILDRHGLTHRRTGKYEPKGKWYPVLPVLMPNQAHRADFVEPRHLKGPVRFYSLNAWISGQGAARLSLCNHARDKASLTALGLYGPHGDA